MPSCRCAGGRRVAVIATGDELVPPGTPTGPDQIVASNSAGVVAFAETIGAVAQDLGIVRDDRRRSRPRSTEPWRFLPTSW